jgi:hypothetical protein
MHYVFTRGYRFRGLEKMPPSSSVKMVREIFILNYITKYSYTNLELSLVSRLSGGDNSVVSMSEFDGRL